MEVFKLDEYMVESIEYFREIESLSLYGVLSAINNDSDSDQEFFRHGQQVLKYFNGFDDTTDDENFMKCLLGQYEVVRAFDRERTHVTGGGDMTEKIKITQEQADAISIMLRLHSGNVDSLIDSHAEVYGDEHNGWTDDVTALNDISPSKLSRALLYGYTIEKNLKEGDWVITGRGVIGTFLENDNGVYVFKGRNNAICKSDNLRHATDEEIQAEKKCIWWSRHERQVWELKKGDVLSWNCEDNGELFEEVNCLYKKGVYLIDGRQVPEDEVLEKYRVMCFVEDRKDI